MLVPSSTPNCFKQRPSASEQESKRSADALLGKCARPSGAIKEALGRPTKLEDPRASGPMFQSAPTVGSQPKESNTTAHETQHLKIG
eukprot:6607850-Pyramimonas_sp.AAC.1